MATKLTSIKDAVSALSTLTGITEQRIERFVNATADTTDAGETATDALVGRIVRVNSTDYLCVKRAISTMNGIVHLEGSMVKYSNSSEDFAVSYSKNASKYVREEMLNDGTVPVLTDEEFKECLKDSVVPAETILNYLVGEVERENKKNIENPTLVPTTEVFTGDLEVSELARVEENIEDIMPIEAINEVYVEEEALSEETPVEEVSVEEDFEGAVEKVAEEVTEEVTSEETVEEVVDDPVVENVPAEETSTEEVTEDVEATETDE